MHKLSSLENAVSMGLEVVVKEKLRLACNITVFFILEVWGGAVWCLFFCLFVLVFVWLLGLSCSMQAPCCSTWISL